MRIYLKLEVDFADEEDVAKLARFGKDARAVRDLLVQMWLYSKRNLSDGKVPVEQVGKLVYPDPPKTGVRDADRLVEIGLAEHRDGGYYLPGYLKHNKSRAQVLAEKERKAEAGRAGGLASGLVRKVEAETKHNASEGSNTENREQRTENNVKNLGGERPETLRAVDATKPPTCQTHPDGNFDGPCGGCKRVREWGDKGEARAKADAVKAAKECVDCGGTGWREDPTTKTPTRKCDHRSTRRTAS